MAYSNFPPSSTANLIERLQEVSTIFPEKRIFTYLTDGENQEEYLTNQTLFQKSSNLAAFLQNQFEAQNRVLLLFQPGLDYIVSFLGCLLANMPPIPIYVPRSNERFNTFGPILSNAQPHIVLTNSQVFDKLSPLFQEAIQPLSLVLIDQLPKHTLSWLSPLVAQDTLAYLQYTSGSTSQPKGVMISHGNLMHNLEQIRQRMKINSDDIGCFWLPPYHDMGLVGCILTPIYIGFNSTLLPPLQFLQKPIRWLEAMSKYKATISGGPNFAYDLCCQRISQEQLEMLDLSKWRLAFNGSEKIRVQTLQAFADKFKRCQFQMKTFFPCYGLAESTLIVTGIDAEEEPIFQTFQKEALANQKEAIPANGSEEKTTLVSCGSETTEQQVKIVDSLTCQECGYGQIGEIWIRGNSIAQGYWKNPTLTKEVFHASIKPETNGTYFRTGDQGFIWRKQLYVTGRLKELIIIRGKNYAPQDIESTLETQFDFLQKNGCVACSIEIDGKEELLIITEVQRMALRTLNCLNSIASMKQAIVAHFQLKAHEVVLVKPISLPRTSSGKLKRLQCKIEFVKNRLKKIS